MVKAELQSDMNYAEKFDQYWSDLKLPHIPSSANDAVAEQIISTCGFASVLDVGSGDGMLVKALLKKGLDAIGIDVSKIVTDSCNQKMPGRFGQASVLALPYPDDAFSIVVSVDTLNHLSMSDVSAALREIYRVAKKYVFLKITINQPFGELPISTSERRHWWENKCFEAGFRKHPAYYKLNDYESLNFEAEQIYILLEKVSFSAREAYPLQVPITEQDVHRDMLRESSINSDASLWRYHFAAKYIRPGDVVLDVACGLGYGTHLLRTMSSGGKFTGVDDSIEVINYARENFEPLNNLIFEHCSLLSYLQTIRSNTVDIISAFEIVAQVEKPEEILKEFQRILTPGGRLVISVPNGWKNEDVMYANSFHHSAYKIQQFYDQLSVKFDIEHLFGQTAQRVKLHNKKSEWEARPRSIFEIDLLNLEQGDESEWLLAVVAKSPSCGVDVPYFEKMYTPNELLVAGNALAFMRDYQNPWLVKSVISIGLRTENLVVRAKWCLEILKASSEKSADRGAVLCNLAYLELSAISVMPRDTLILQIGQYLYNCRDVFVSNVVRWQVSLRYVRALFFLENGQHEQAVIDFLSISPDAVVSYHATLLTKLAESIYQHGMILAAKDQIEAAQKIWKEGFQQLKKFLAAHLSIEHSGLPPDFETRELSALLAIIGRLCVASKYTDCMRSRPVLFYEQLNADFVSQQVKSRQENLFLQLFKEDIKNKQEYILLLFDGKNWLEQQWLALQEEIKKRDIVLYEELRKKDVIFQEEMQKKDLASIDELRKNEMKLKKEQGEKKILEEDFQLATTQLHKLQTVLVELEKKSNLFEQHLSRINRIPLVGYLLKRFVLLK